MTAHVSIKTSIVDSESDWLDRLCQPQVETESQQILSAAVSARLKAVLELYDDFRVALFRFYSKRGPRPTAGLYAVLRLIDDVQPSELELLMNGLKRLEAVAPKAESLNQLRRLNEVLEVLHPAARAQVEGLLTEIDRLALEERSEYKECFLRVRRDDIAKTAPAVFEELKKLDEVEANGRIAKLNIIRILPMFIRYLLAMEARDSEEATELFAEMGRFQPYDLTLLGLHLKPEELEEVNRRLTGLRRRALTSLQQLNATNEAAQANKLEAEMLQVFGVLADDMRGFAEKALRAFENAESTVDEMMALTDLRKVCPVLAAKAKRWRAMTEKLRKVRQAGHQLEKVQRALTLFGPGYAAPTFFRDPSTFDEMWRQQETTCESLVAVSTGVVFVNCMTATMQLAAT